jgi:hypothetical protein
MALEFMRATRDRRAVPRVTRSCASPPADQQPNGDGARAGSVVEGPARGRGPIWQVDGGYGWPMRQGRSRVSAPTSR